MTFCKLKLGIHVTLWSHDTRAWICWRVSSGQFSCGKIPCDDHTINKEYVCKPACKTKDQPEPMLDSEPDVVPNVEMTHQTVADRGPLATPPKE